MRVLVLLALLLTACATRSGDEDFDWGAASKAVGQTIRK